MARQTLAVCFALLLLLLAPPCFAGLVHVEDPENRFDASTETSIEALGPSLPFDAVVLVTSKPASVSALDRFVGAHVGAPNLVVVGVDPVNRRSSVHFGTGVGVARSDFKAVEQAGIPAFKKRDWGGGVRAILERASSVRSAPAVVTTTAAPVTVPERPPVTVPPAPIERKPRSSGLEAMIGVFGILLLMGLFLLLVGGAIFLALRAVFGRSASSGTANYGTTGYGAPGGYPTPFRHGYGYAEAPHQHGSTLGTVATHGAAAVAGAAVGYAASRYLDSDSSSSSSWDNSSSSTSSWDNSSSSSSWESSAPTTSSWDSSSTSDSSSSSWDSGGSSSSWDSGGSSDFGSSGGSDFGGGGGSDWS